jgi:hypothetical protein
MNAATRGVEHSICIQDIPTPEFCCYLKLKLVYRENPGKKIRTFDTASIDRIDSTKGYIPGNIQIISDLANRMKQNATIDQMLAFAKGILEIHGSK